MDAPIDPGHASTATPDRTAMIWASDAGSCLLRISRPEVKPDGAGSEPAAGRCVRASQQTCNGYTVIPSRPCRPPPEAARRTWIVGEHAQHDERVDRCSRRLFAQVAVQLCHDRQVPTTVVRPTVKPERHQALGKGRTSCMRHHLQQLGKRRQRVPSHQLVDVRQHRSDTALDRLVADSSPVRVHPHDGMREPL